MSQTSQFLIRHGLPVVFTAVLVEQMGLPLPALPWLLAAGALAAIGKFNLALGLLTAVVACLLAETLLPPVKNAEPDRLSVAVNPALKSVEIEPPTPRKEQLSETDIKFE